MSVPMLVTFVGGAEGQWRISSSAAVTGQPLDPASKVAVLDNEHIAVPDGVWTLRGVTSNERYVERPERTALQRTQAPLARPEATAAALIPIRKSPAWWDLTQDERRAILEQRSHHIEIGLRYLPAVARRLHHSRDLHEPFDFLTWFEFAPRYNNAFDELVGRLRETDEWTFVDWEVDIRLARINGAHD